VMGLELYASGTWGFTMVWVFSIDCFSGGDWCGNVTCCGDGSSTRWSGTLGIFGAEKYKHSIVCGCSHLTPWLFSSKKLSNLAIDSSNFQ
jgi:hypothetical protein